MLNNVKYLSLIIGLNTLIWGTVYTYITKAPKSYVSQWSIILPGTSSNSSVNIDQLGQANSGGDNAYVSGSIIDPRANLKVIATSPEVKTLAANLANIPESEFGGVTAKLVDPTSTVELSIKGDSPKNAQLKALAFNKAFELKINQLRVQDIEKRNTPNAIALNSALENLNNKRQELINFKSQNRLTGDTQLTSLVNTLAALKQQQIVVEAQRQQESSKLNTLSSQLKLTPTQVVSSYNLTSDSILQQSIADYSLATTTLNSQSSAFLPNHPTIVNLSEKRNTVRNAMLNRASQLVGRNVSESELSSLLVANPSTPGGASDRSVLYNSLVSLRTDVNGLTSQSNSLSSQMNELENRVNNLAKLQPVLGSLEQQLRTAELVYNSTISRIELTKGNLFTTYPLTQVLVEPSLPSEPSSPKITLALLGGAVASSLISLALIALWLRSLPKNDKVLHKIHKQDTKVLRYETK